MSGDKVTLPSHKKRHQIDSIRDHKPIPGDHDENAVVVMDSNGLPTKDSGIQLSTLVSGLSPIGPWDASGGTYPIPLNIGDFWWISVAGIIDGVDYNIHDWLVYVDDSGVPADDWKKVDNSDLGTDHAVLTNLPWSSAGHTIDSGIDLPTPATDLTWTGWEKTLQAAAITTKFQIAYMNGSSKMALAKADAESTSKGLLAIAGEALALDATGKYILPKSLIRNDAWTWTPGGELYISEITAGAITQTPPAVVAGNVVRVIGYAISATVILFDPDKTWIVIG